MGVMKTPMLHIDRRDFIRAGVPFAALPFLGGGLSVCSSMVMRLGVMTDTHIGKTIESCSRVRQALELFKSKGCDMVIHCGDIADWHYPTGYAAYRQVFDEVCGGAPHPETIYVYAWHDAFAYKGCKRSETRKASLQAFPEVQRLLKAKNGPLEKIVFRGYVFLVFPQFVGEQYGVSYEEYDRMIASACAETPGRPVFVLDHLPPHGPVYNTFLRGDKRRTRVLSKYPQAVHLSGHIHGSLRNDLMIWQKDFTAINAGCLQKWRGDVCSDTEPAKHEYGVLTIDVFQDRLLARRWDVRDGAEICPAAPWTVPLPFVAETAPYRFDRRVALSRPPSFAVGASVSVRCDGDPLKRLVVDFPEADGDVFKYRVDLQVMRRGEWGGLSSKEVISEYWKRAQDRTGCVTTQFAPELLEAGMSYRAMVTPISQYGLAGTPIVDGKTALSAKPPAMKLVWECADPMESLRLMHWSDPRKAKTPPYPHRREDDGWYGKIGGGGARFELPKGVFAGNPGDIFAVVIDAKSVQPMELTLLQLMTFTAIDPATAARISPPCRTFRGDSGFQRYVLLVKQPKDKVYPDAHIAVEQSTSVEQRFMVERIRVFKLNGGEQ